MEPVLVGSRVRALYNNNNNNCGNEYEVKKETSRALEIPKMLRRFPVDLSVPAPAKLPRDVCGQPRPGCALWQAVCWPQ